MGNISFHNNQSSYRTGIKNTIYVKANVINKYAKYQLYPPYGFRDSFLIFLSKINPFVALATYKLRDFD